MALTIDECPEIASTKYVFTISREIMEDVKLDKFDRAVINSPIETAADVAQNLEIILRRYYQQTTPPNKEQDDV